jgi:hypothetical protein
MLQSHSTLSDIQVDPQLLQKAFETSKGNVQEISALINHTLQRFINKAKLEALGYKEMLFHIAKHHEVKRVFTKLVLTHHIVHDPKDHMNDPYFSGVIYPNTSVNVFITPKNNIIVQKSTDQEIHFCNGRVIQEQTTHRMLEFKVVNHVEAIQHEIPEAKFATVYNAINANGANRLKEILDEEFYNELEL